MTDDLSPNIPDDDGLDMAENGDGPFPDVAMADQKWVPWLGGAFVLGLGALVFFGLLHGQQKHNGQGQFATAQNPQNADPRLVEQADAPQIYEPAPSNMGVQFGTGLNNIVGTQTSIVPGSGASGMPTTSYLPLNGQSPPPPPPTIIYRQTPNIIHPAGPSGPLSADTNEGGSSVASATPPPPSPTPSPTPAMSDQRLRSPALIVDNGQANGANLNGTIGPVVPGAQASAGDGAGATNLASDASRARRMVNPSATVPQGALIPAILETAINSDLPGSVRAIVSRDVRSFDGSTVLVPRGARLTGEYNAEIVLGQSRALVVWTRLIRADGVVIDLRSPAADQMGRAGLSGDVNRHMLQRYAPGYLLTMLNAALSRSRSTQVVLGSATISAPPVDAIRPTISIPAGARVQVFVARDLDFTAVTAAYRAIRRPTGPR